MNIASLLGKVAFETLPNMLSGLKDTVTYRRYLTTAYDSDAKASIDTYDDTEDVEAIKIDDKVEYQQAGSTTQRKRIQTYLLKTADLSSQVTPSSAMRDKLVLSGVTKNVIYVEPILDAFLMVDVEA